MELRQLTTFRAVARLQSFTQAADSLGYAQSTVTGHVKELEDELGVRLFDRLGKQVELTEAGERLLKYSEQILDLLEKAANEVSSMEEAKGTITVGAAESLCLGILAGFLRDYRDRHPGVVVKIRFETCCEMFTLLKNNQIDVAFFLDRPFEDDALVSRFMFNEPVYLVASPKHPLAAKDTVEPRDLSGQHLILTESGCSYRTIFEAALADAGITPCSTMEVGSIAVMKGFVVEDMGLAVMTRVAAEAEIAAGKLVVLPWRGPSFDVQALLVHHKDKWLSPALKTFIDEAMELLGQAP